MATSGRCDNEASSVRTGRTLITKRGALSPEAYSETGHRFLVAMGAHRWRAPSRFTSLRTCAHMQAQSLRRSTARVLKLNALKPASPFPAREQEAPCGKTPAGLTRGARPRLCHNCSRMSRKPHPCLVTNITHQVFLVQPLGHSQTLSSAMLAECEGLRVHPRKLKLVLGPSCSPPISTGVGDWRHR